LTPGIQGLGQGPVGAEKLSQGSVEGFVVTSEGDDPIELDGLSCPLLGGRTHESGDQDAFDCGRLLEELLVAAGKIEIQADR
jgi:hypothetical protein